MTFKKSINLAIILASLIFLAAIFVNLGNTSEAGTSNSFIVQPEDQISTATLSNINSNGTDGVEIDASYVKSLSDTKTSYDRSNLRQTYPRATVTDDGNMYVVYHELAGNVYIQKYNSSGVRQWSEDKQALVSSCSYAQGTYQNTTAVAEYGNEVIISAICYNSGTTLNEVFAQRLNSSGETQWVSDVRVHDDTVLNKINPEVVTIGTEIFVAWQDERDGAGDYDIYLQELDSAGNRAVVGDMLVHDQGATTIHGPYMEVSSTDKIVISYSYSNSIYINQYNADRSANLASTQVGAGTVGSKLDFGFTVMGTDSYHFFKRWSAVPPNFQIYGQKMSVLGAKMWNAGTELRVGRRVIPARIEAWNDGTNPYFGSASFSGINFPHGKKVDASNGTSLWGGEFDDEPPLVVGTGDSVSFWVVYNNGQNHVFYQKTNGGYMEDIFYNQIDSSSNINWAADVVVCQDFETANQQEIDIVKNGSGNVFAAWVDNRAGGASDNIYANLFDSNGDRQWSSDTLVNSGVTSANYSSPKVINVGTDYYITWENTSRAYVNKLNTSGTRQWADVEISVGGGSSVYNPSIAYDGTNIVIVWDDNRASDGANQIYFNSVNSAGMVQLGSDQVVNVTGTNKQEQPEIRSDQTDTYVVWEDSRSGTDTIYMQKVNGSGVPQYGADVKINDDTVAFRYDPDLIISGSITYIVWEDTRNKTNPTADIYIASFNGDTRVLADTKVNEDEAASKINPRIGISTNLYVIWQDYRNSVTYNDIYINSLTTAGVRQYSLDTLLSTQAGNVVAENPSITPNDKFVAWDDDRNGATNFDTFLANGADAYSSSGTISGTGLILDAGSSFTDYSTITWSKTTPANTSILLQTRSASTLAGLTSASWSTAYATSGDAVLSTDLQFIEIQATLATTDTSVTPTLSDVTINYNTNLAPIGTNLTINSKTDWMVDYSYDLTDTDDSSAIVTMEYWNGTGFVATTNVTGLGEMSTGSNHTAIWDAKKDLTYTNLTTKIRLSFDDQFIANNTSTLTSSQFDLKVAPTSEEVVEEDRVYPPYDDPIDELEDEDEIVTTFDDNEKKEKGFLGKIYDKVKKAVISVVMGIAASKSSTAAVSFVAILLINSFWGFNFYQLLGYLRKKRRWGMVYDYKTKRPVPFAKVILVSVLNKKIVNSVNCNNIGEFGFLVKPGEYYVEVGSNSIKGIVSNKSKTDQKRFNKGRRDSIYKNIYYKDEIIEIKDTQKMDLELDISVPVLIDQNAAKNNHLLNLYNTFKRVLVIIRIPILLVGSLIAISLFIYRGNNYDIGILILYILLWIWMIYELFTHESAVMNVVEKESGLPLSLVVSRLVSDQDNKIEAVAVTDKYGRAVFGGAKTGNYTICSAKSGYKEKCTNSFKLATLKKFGKIKIELITKE